MFTVLPKSWIVRPEDELPIDAEPLLREYQQLIFYKANLDVFTNPHLGELVKVIKVREYIVFGVATDYCVTTMVEGLLARNAKVAVATDAIRALDAAKGQDALRRFAEQGVRLIRTTEVVNRLDNESAASNTGDDLDDAL
jgi:nicotinamidase-related amidase